MSTTSAAQSLVALLRNTNAATLRNVLLQRSLQEVADALVQLPVADQASVLRVRARRRCCIRRTSRRRLSARSPGDVVG